MGLIVINKGLFSKSTPPIIDKKIINKEVPVVNYSGNIMVSHDKGLSWKTVDEGLPVDKQVQAISITKDKIYIGFGKNKIYTKANINDAVWKIENLDELYFNKQENGNLSSFYKTESGLYATSLFGDLYKKSNGKANWIPLKKPKDLHMVTDLKEDKNGDLYLTSDYGLYKFEDHIWKQIYNQGRLNQVMFLENKIMVSGFNGIYISKDQGANWSQVHHQQSLSTLNLNKEEYVQLSLFQNGIAALRSDDDQTYLNSNSGKFRISIDGGKTWQTHKADEYLKTLKGVNKVIFQDGRLYCSYDGGIIVSDDNGRTWKTLLAYQKTQQNSLLELFISCYERNFGC
jgi:photosystem II stability/assembly factor-like uncharacterized protein